MASSTFMVAVKRQRAMKSSVHAWEPKIAAELDKISLEEPSIHPALVSFKKKRQSAQTIF